MSIRYTKWIYLVGGLISVWGQERGAAWRYKLLAFLLMFKAMRLGEVTKEVGKSQKRREPGAKPWNRSFF